MAKNQDWKYSMRRWTLVKQPRVTIRGTKTWCRVYVDETPVCIPTKLETAKEIGIESSYRRELL